MEVQLKRRRTTAHNMSSLRYNIRSLKAFSAPESAHRSCLSVYEVFEEVFVWQLEQKA